MEINNKSNLLQVINQTYFLFLIIYSAAANDFVRSFNGLITLFAATLFIICINQIKISEKLLISFGVWIIYFICSTISIRTFHPHFLIEIPIIILCAYTAINIFQGKCFGLYVKYVYYLSIIGLVLYFIQLGYPPIIESFYSVLNIQGDFLTENAARTGNFIIYSYSIENDVLFERNCGFAWEPGAYSCFCLIALLINVLMMNKKKSIVNTILLLALVTTRSTTGYVLLFISVFLVLFFNVKSQAKYLLVIFMIVISIIVWNLDFVGEKMSDQFNMAEIDRIETLIDWSIEYDTTYYLSRFDSFLLAMMDFSSHPIFGYGGNTSLQYSTTQGANVVTISGIGTLLARYGIYGFIGWIYLLCKSGQFYNSHKNKSLGGNMLVIWFFLNIGIAISYLLILSPVFFILYFFPFFSEEEQSATKPSDASSADSVLDPAS